jgi:very-short-patch-repair endonuclease
MVSEGMKERRAATRRLQTLARHMRHEPTSAEARFWHHARNRAIGGMKFRRQVPVGPYIADFLCLEEMLIVEIDGGQHGEDSDGKRDAFLRACGYRVLRFWNSDLADMDAVVGTILAARPPHPALSPGGGEEW